MEEIYNFDDAIAGMNSGSWNGLYNPYAGSYDTYYTSNTIPLTTDAALTHVQINSLKIEVEMLRTEINELKKKLNSTGIPDQQEHRKLDINGN